MGRRKISTRRFGHRDRWLTASSIAMATAMLHPVPALAQSTTDGVAVRAQAQYTNGTLTYTPGTPTPSGTATDTVRVNTANTLINWVPYDTATGGGPITFLPAGNGLFYIFDGGNYTVVNRILPTDATRAVRFDGQVASFVNNGGAIGGNIFFFSPGGIIVGGTGRFDVGSLVLTTSEITQTVSTSTTLAFAPATQPNSKVTIEPWSATGAGDVSAQLQTIGGNSYLALVAPTVEMFGRVDAPGNIAYVAAEAATMTISGSLFDIVVNTGTTSTKGVEHTGTTSGSTYGGPDRRIQMVAVPKNDALTMLVSGAVGYQQASSAAIVNGRIVLTAGAPGDDADLEIGEASFGQSVTATATGDIRIAADGAGASIAVDDGMNALDFTATAGGNISVDLTNGAGMNVSGNMSLKAGSGDTGGDIAIKADATGVIAPTSSNGLDIGGDLTLNSSAVGVSNFATGGIASDAVAGDISITLAQGAQFAVGGNLTVDAFAQAGFGDLQSGDATGGSVTIEASGAGGAFNVTGDTDIDAGARAAFSLVDGGPSAGEAGGDATGGNVSLAFNGVDTTFGGALQVNTNARASSGRNAAIVQDNAARAGDIALSFTGGTHDLFYLDLDAAGNAGLSFDGAGNGVAGTVGRALVDIALDGATVTTADDNTIDASTAGDISASIPADAITLTAVNGSSFTSGYFEASASHDNVGSTNAGTAGGIAVTADNSTLALGSLTLETNAFASSSAAADKSGGAITISASNGSTITASDASLRSGVNEPIDAVGPSVNTGGAISLIAADSDITFTGGSQLDASVGVSRGGDGSAAPSTGGAITIRQTGVDSDLTFNTLSVSTAAALPDGGSNDFLGNGGNAAGGTVTVDVQGGTFTADSLLISSFATGQTGGSQIATAGGLAGDGGSARSGDILITAAGTLFDPGVVALSNTATGGIGGTGLASLGAAGAGAGGAATAGSVVFDLLAGTVNLEALSVILPPVEVIGPVVGPFIPTFNVGATAVGGTGGFGDGTPGGAGGAATGGTAIFNSAGADVTVSTAAVGVFSGAYGGAGGNSQANSGTGSYGGPAGAGGNATGGTATYLFTGGTTNVTAALVDASAFGGIGGNHTGFSGGPLSAGGIGGSALGGTATITLGADDTSSALYTVTARATGGDGGDGTYAGAGGDAQGGAARFNVDNANVSAYSLQVDASAYGGEGGYPYRGGAPGGAGGNATGGTAGIDVFGLAGVLTTDQGIDITSTGVGGDGARGSYLGDGGAGGYGRGGSIVIAARDGANLELLISNVVDASGRGGSGGPAGSYDGNPPGPGGTGGGGYGGSIEVHASGATLTASTIEGPVQFSATGSGGAGGDSGYSGYYGYYGGQGTPGGNGISAGGSINLEAFESGLFQVNGDLRADASGIGRLDTRLRSTGSDAAGGEVRLDIDSGGAFVVTGNATLEASALATLGRDTIGNASGGTVGVTMDGTGSLLDIAGSLRADVSATDNRPGGFFSSGPTGGDTAGGQIVLDFLAGTASVAGTLELFAMAGIETSEGSVLGGSATAGDISLLNDGAADLTFADVTIDSSARGTFGNRPSGGTPGEAGGDAFGGDVTLSNRGTGSLTATSITIDAGAQGGYGGRGTEGSYGAGGAGGNAVGGTVLVANGSTLSVQDLTVVADAIGGQGGSGAGGFDGGIGGQGQGGAITFTSSQTVADLNQLSLSASGRGGTGARGDGYYGAYGQGSRGGDGVGGSISIDFAGVGTTLSGLATFVADTNGNGGSGGTGAGSYGDGADGGTGGDGTGGSLAITARSGALVDLSSTSSFSSNGYGGVGGNGGAGGYADGTGSYGGDGGAGGNGAGGSVTLVAQGGTITSGTIAFTASGFGGGAGYGGTGYYDYETYGGGMGGRLAGGSGTGGLVSLQALEGSPGVISLGAVTIDASGLLGGSGVTIPTVGGSIEIIDASTDPAGLITMGSLVATALGAVPPADASFTMSGDSGPITILDVLSVNVVGDIVFDFDGSGRLVVGGTTFLNAGGDILLTHTNNSAGVISIDSSGDFTATAGGSFAAGSGTVANGSGNVSITAQDITYDAIDALGFVRLNALTGGIGFAGTGTIIAGTFIDLDAAQAIAIGDADAETGFTINAGDDVAFGTITNSNNDLSVVAGGSVNGVSAINDAPVGSGGLSRTILTAGGDIVLTGTAQSVKDGVFLSATGNISAATIDAGINAQALANGTVTVGTVNSGTGALLQGTSVTLDNGSVGGNLMMTATSGSIASNGTITVGGTADFDAPGGITFGSLTAGNGFTANAGGNIGFGFAGTTGGDLVFAAGGSVLGGDLDVAGLLSLTGTLISIGNASGMNLSLSSASDIVFDSLTSPNAISLTATNGTIGANAGPGDIDSGGDVSLDARGVSVGNVTSGGSVSATATAGDATFAAINAANDITVTASGTSSIANAISGGNTTITGASIAFNSGDVGGMLRLDATAGDIESTGTVAVGGAIDFDATGNVVFGSLDAGGAFAVDAGGTITFARATSPVSLTMNAGAAISGGDLDVAGPLSLSGGTIAVGDAVADSIAFASDTDILFNSIIVRGPLSLVAAGGAIGANTGGAGDISADGSVTLLAQALALGDLTSGGSLDAEATAGDITFGRVIAAGDIALDAPAGFVSVDHAEAGGDFVANSLTGFATGPNSILTGGDILISTGGAAGLGNSNAGGLIDVTAGHVDFLTLVAGGTINLLTQLRPNGPAGDGDIVGTAMMAGAGGSSLDAFGSIAVAGPLDIGGSLSVSASGSATLGSVDAATSFSGSAGGDFEFASVDAAGDVSVSAGGQVGIAAGGTGNITATAGAISISGNAIDVGDLAAGSAIALNASTAVGLGDATAADDISIVAGSDVTFGVITGRDIQISAGAAIIGASAISPDSTSGLIDRVSLQAGGNVTVGAIQAADVVDIDGSTIVVGSLSSTSGSVVGTGTVAIGAVSGNGSHSIAGTAVTLGSISIGGGTAAVNATAGPLAVTGAIIAGNVDFDAAGNVGFGDATVAGVVDVDSGGSIATGTVIARDIQLTAALDIVSASLVSANATAGVPDRVVLDAGGDIAVTGLTRGADLVTFDAGGSVDAGDILSDGAVTINAASVAIGDAAAGAFALTSGSDIVFDSLTSNSAVSLTAASGTIGANEGPGDITSNGDVTLSAQDIALGNVTSGGSVGATATTGNASFGTVDAATNISVTAAGTPTFARAISGGHTSITGASVSFNSGDIGGDLSLTATLGSIASNGTVNVGGAIAFAAPGDVSFGTLAAQGGDFAVSAGGAIGFTAGSANGEIGFAAGGAIAGGSLSADGAITAEAGSTLTLGSANAGDALDLRAASTLTLADAIGGTVALRSANGAVIVTNDIDSTFSGDGQQVIVSGAAVQIDDVNDLLLTLVQATDGDIDAVAAGDIGVVAAESAGDINLTSTGGDVRVSLAEAGKTAIVPVGAAGAIAPAGTQIGSPGPGNISILAGGVAQGSFVASGDIGIEAGSTIDLNGADAGGAIALSSGGSTRVFGTAAAGGDIVIASGGDVRVTSSNASLEAGGDLAVQAGGTFDTQGFAYGTHVAVTAGDVIIGASGKVGDAGQTTSVTFTGVGTINVGGDAVAANFSLDADEIGRIENSGDLTFRALNGGGNNGSDVGTIGTAAVNTSGPARIVIGDIAVVAGSGGQMGSNSTLRLDSQGGVDVLGNLTVAGAGEESGLSIRSNGPTWLDTAGGNLRIEDVGGAATGIIDIDSASFMAVSADALADIDGLGAADINARLADNDGVVRSDGFIQAGTLDVRVSDAFFVQNSGDGDSSDLDTRRGFAVQFLSVETGEGAGPLVVINGTVGGQTGPAVLSAADLGSGFAAGSTINGCLIANPAGCIPVAPPPGPVETSFDDPARDLIEEDFDPTIELEGDLDSMLIDFAPSEQFQDDPLIDDPVTGAGNEDFWVGEPSCEPGSEDEASCPTSKEAQPESQQAQEDLEPAE